MPKYRLGSSKFPAIERDVFDEEVPKRIAGNYPDIRLNEEEDSFLVSFDFIDASFSNSKYCLNSPFLTLFDYNKLISFFKELSGITIGEITKSNKKSSIDKYSIKRINIILI